ALERFMQHGQQFSCSSPDISDIFASGYGMQRGVVRSLRPPSGIVSGEAAQVFVELMGLEPENIDHLVLVVSNCVLKAAQVNTKIENDDEKKYIVMASAS